MSKLREYERKRDFSKTREPDASGTAKRGKRAIFVVQLHHASRRYFDFRLQVGDVLRSWAGAACLSASTCRKTCWRMRRRGLPSARTR